MTSYQKLLKALKTRDLTEAHELFKDIMQQKVALRLAEEKKTLMKEDDHKCNYVDGKCECGMKESKK